MMMQNRTCPTKPVKNISTEYELSDDIRYSETNSIYGLPFTVDAALYPFGYKTVASMGTMYR